MRVCRGVCTRLVVLGSFSGFRLVAVHEDGCWRLFARQWPSSLFVDEQTATDIRRAPRWTVSDQDSDPTRIRLGSGLVPIWIRFESLGPDRIPEARLSNFVSAAVPLLLALCVVTAGLPQRVSKHPSDLNRLQA